MITTKHKSIDEKLRLLRHQGMSVSDLARHKSNRVIFESYPVAGYNYRMTDMQAAIGLAQLKKLGKIIALRRRLAQRYLKLLSQVKESVLPKEPGRARSN